MIKMINYYDLAITANVTTGTSPLGDVNAEQESPRPVVSGTIIKGGRRVRGCPSRYQKDWEF